jgi:alginate O-acetyltransferase complex protein AlgI
LWVVYVLCGFWHGASWNFVIWGAIHGFFMVLERAGLDRVLHWIWRPFRHLYMLLVYNFAFAFFLTKSIPDALVYLSVMVGLTSGEAPKDIAMTLFAQDKQIIFTLGILASLPWRSIFEGVRKQKHLHVNGSRSAVALKLDRLFGTCARATHVMFLISVLFISMMYIAAGTYNPFIYFRF